MKIAVLGTGKVGSALGLRLASAGHDVVFGSRRPDPATPSVSHRDAVVASDVIITALPGTEVVTVLEGVGEDLLADRVILDPSAAFGPEMSLAYPGDSVAQQIQRRFPRARVVKALNTMNHTIMVDPLSSVAGATVFVSGDDTAAKDTVIAALRDLGWPDASILDLGGVETALATEHLAPLFFATAVALKSPNFNIAVVR